MQNRVKGFVGLICLCVAVTVPASAFPLRIDMDVNAKCHRKTVEAGQHRSAKQNEVQCKVKIRKSSGSDYSQPLTAELYIIGKQAQTGYVGIIDVIKKDFTFTDENNHEYRFESNVYSALSTYQNIKAGGVYETYLLIVLDNDGVMVDYRTGRPIGEEGVAIIREMGTRTLFDRDGNVVGKVKKKQSEEAMETAILPAISSNE